LVAIHRITVISNTMAPTTETDWPSHNRRQFRFCRKPGAGASAVIRALSLTRALASGGPEPARLAFTVYLPHQPSRH
jgi:hypothetical protein